MNKNYKDSKRINKIIELILDSTELWGRENGKEMLRDHLEAVAEVAFLEGQSSIKNEILDLEFKKSISESKKYSEKSFEQIDAEEEVIKDFAHDYRNMTLDYEEVTSMLKNFWKEMAKIDKNYPKVKY